MKNSNMILESKKKNSLNSKKFIYHLNYFIYVSFFFFIKVYTKFINYYEIDLNNLIKIF